MIITHPSGSLSHADSQACLATLRSRRSWATSSRLRLRVRASINILSRICRLGRARRNWGRLCHSAVNVVDLKHRSATLARARPFVEIDREPTRAARPSRYCRPSRQHQQPRLCLSAVRRRAAANRAADGPGTQEGSDGFMKRTQAISARRARSHFSMSRLV